MGITDNITKEVLEYSKNHTKSKTYLYNNRLWFSKLITDNQYNINWLFIKNN